MQDLPLPTIILLLIVAWPILKKLFLNNEYNLKSSNNDYWKKKDIEWRNKERTHSKNSLKALKEYEKSEYYARKSDYKKVIFHLTNAINFNPTERYYSSRAGYKGIIQDFNGAVEDYSKVIELEPDRHYSWYHRGNAHQRLGNIHLAYRDWKKAEELGFSGATNAIKLYCKQISHEVLKENTSNDNTLLKLKNNWIKSKTDEIFDYVSVIELLKETSINEVSYSCLLKCFEWQFKRFKILVRDGFICVDCKEVSDRLHVHHTYYLKDKLPWEIEDLALVSLCRSCHSKRHEQENIYVYKEVENRLILANHYFSICQRCNGTGYLPQFKHVENGICFLCFGNVMPKTIFSRRLTEISTNPNIYNELIEECIDFLDSISLDFYISHIHEKLYAKKQIEIDEEIDDLPF